MAIDIKYSKAARSVMAEGIEKLFDAVKVTLGPKGRNVIIEQEFGTPLITNDGVTIAKAIDFENKYQNLGAKILIEAASKTNDSVGDGTTTVIVLATKLILEGLKKVEEGINPVTLKKGLEYFLPIVVEKIKEKSQPINSFVDLNYVATISSGNPEIGKILENAYSEIGVDGLITIQESNNVFNDLVITQGYSFDRTLLSPYLASDEKENLELENPLILITNKKITMMQQIVPYLEEAIKKVRPLLIICDDMEASVLNTVIVNKLRGVFNAAVVKTPSYGGKKLKQLEDMAIYTGGKFINAEIIEEEHFLDIDALGTCEKVVITKDKTTLINGAGSEEDIYNRVELLKHELIHTETEYEKEKIFERISKLVGGVAVIRVGAPTEVELKEMKLRIEDAIHATKAASISGVIDGGGKVLYNIADELDEIVCPDIYKTSKQILQKALRQPFYQILENCGQQQNIIDLITGNDWYDAENDIITDIRKNGVIDPAGVAISAVTNAISVSSVFLTTECAITINHNNKQIKEEELI